MCVHVMPSHCDCSVVCLYQVFICTDFLYMYSICNTQPSDAQTLSQVAMSLTVLDLMVSHTDCVALSTVCSLPKVRVLTVAVCSDVKAST